jgi:putative ABC transport system permease protein
VSRWGTALRIARRTAWRSPGRTVLVGALVAAPVLGTAFLDTAFRTAELTGATQAQRQMGTADAVLTVTSSERISVTGTSYASTERDGSRDPRTVDPATVLPPGSRLLERRSDSTVAFVTGDRTTLTPAAEMAWGDPLAAGLLTLREGRLAGAAGEVTLSPTLAERLGAGIGDEVRQQDGRTARVVGIASEPSCRSCQLAAGPPGWTGAVPTDGVAPDHLVDLPDGTVVDRALQEALGERGVFLLPRDALLHPNRWADPGVDDGGDPTTIAVIVLVAGIGMLEVVLLAGAAFAVAARRQVRDSALVLSNGGRRTDVRRILLAQGAVLGVLGSVTGLALGVLAVLAAWGPLQRLTNQDFGGLVVSPRDLVITGLVGVAAGVAAAVVPAASAARVPVVAALAGRYGSPSATRVRVSAAAAVAAAGGLVAAGLIAGAWAAARRTGTGSVLYPIGMLAGFGTTMVALTVLAPSLVGLTGRFAGRLPLTGRLALRDAARHRHRTGPAVGAVMVAVAGSVAVAFAIASYDARDREQYRPSLPAGWASVYLNTGQGVVGYGSEAEQLATVRAAAAELPDAEAVPLSNAAPADESSGAWPEWVPADPGHCQLFSGVATGPVTAGLIAGPRAGEATAALAAGRAVVTQPCLVGPQGTVTVRVTAFGPDGNPLPDPRMLTVPALVLPGVGGDSLPAGVLPQARLAELGLVPQAGTVVIRTGRAPSGAEEDRARTVLGPLGNTLRVERGYGAPYLPGFVALIGGAGLVTLAGVAISVSLSAAEGRADLATLAAIGAPPRRRRLLAMGQAALVAGLGVGLGVLLGAVIGTTIMSGLDGYPLVVPWPTVLLVGVGVPVLGVLAVGLLTRSRLPMARRLG